MKSGFGESIELRGAKDEMFFVSTRVENELQYHLASHEYRKQLRRFIREWLTGWPNQIGRRVIEKLLPERLFRKSLPANPAAARSD